MFLEPTKTVLGRAQLTTHQVNHSKVVLIFISIINFLAYSAGYHPQGGFPNSGSGYHGYPQQHNGGAWGNGYHGSPGGAWGGGYHAPGGYNGYSGGYSGYPQSSFGGMGGYHSSGFGGQGGGFGGLGGGFGGNRGMMGGYGGMGGFGSKYLNIVMDIFINWFFVRSHGNKTKIRFW